jgi:hypothetical protein
MLSLYLYQGFLLVKVKSSLRKFYCRHYDLVNCYGVSITNEQGYYKTLHRILKIEQHRQWTHVLLREGWQFLLYMWHPSCYSSWLTVTEYLSQMSKDMFRLSITIKPFPHSWLITGFITRVTRRVPHVEQELPTLPEEHMSSLPVLFGL